MNRTPFLVSLSKRTINGLEKRVIPCFKSNINSPIGSLIVAGTYVVAASGSTVVVSANSTSTSSRFSLSCLLFAIFSSENKHCYPTKALLIHKELQKLSK